MRTFLSLLPAVSLLLLYPAIASTAGADAVLHTSRDEDPAIWWTLTDDISPEQLEAIFADTALHRERYREAIRAGLRKPLPEEELALITFFVDGELNPELFQMRVVFESFSTGMVLDPEGPHRERLIDFGFEPVVADFFYSFAEVFNTERSTLEEKTLEEMRPASEFHRLARERMDPRSFSAAHENKDYASFARATGHSVAEVQRFFAMLEHNTLSQFEARTLRALKESISPQDWERLRLFLLQEQAPKMSSIGMSQPEKSDPTGREASPIDRR